MIIKELFSGDNNKFVKYFYTPKEEKTTQGQIGTSLLGAFFQLQEKEKDILKIKNYFDNKVFEEIYPKIKNFIKEDRNRIKYAKEFYNAIIEGYE